MGKGDYDSALQEAFTWEISKIPKFYRFSPVKRRIVIGAMIVFALIGVTSIFWFPNDLVSFETEVITLDPKMPVITDDIGIGKIVFLVVMAIIVLLLFLWIQKGYRFEEKAYSNACDFARDHETWEMETFRKEYEEVMKDANYKN